VSFTFIDLKFEVVVFLPIYVHKQAKHNESLVEQQMIKVLAQTTNNAEQSNEQRKGGKFKCEHFTKFCCIIFCFSEFNLLSFVICFNVVELTLF